MVSLVAPLTCKNVPLPMMSPVIMNIVCLNISHAYWWIEKVLKYFMFVAYLLFGPSLWVFHFILFTVWNSLSFRLFVCHLLVFLSFLVRQWFNQVFNVCHYILCPQFRVILKFNFRKLVQVIIHENNILYFFYYLQENITYLLPVLYEKDVGRRVNIVYSVKQTETIQSPWAWNTVTQ